MNEPQAELQWEVGKSLRVLATTGFAIGVTLISFARRPAFPHLNLALIAAPIYATFWSARDLTPDDFANEIFGRFLLIFLAHASYVLCVLPADQLEEERCKYLTAPAKGSGPSGKENASWMFAYKMLFNARMIGTRWDVTRSSASPRSMGRARFVAGRLACLFLRYVALCVFYDAAVYGWMPDGRPAGAEDFSPAGRTIFWQLVQRYLSAFVSRRTLLNTGTSTLVARGLTLRVHVVAEQILRDYLSLSSYHDVLSILAVGILRVDEPHEWPPLFGGITQAWRVRRYWGRFWHLLIYRSFSGHASAMATWVFGQGRGTSTKSRAGSSVAARYTANALVFVASGAMHRLVERMMSPDCCKRCGCGAMLQWYALQMAGIVAEEVVQAVFRGVIRSLPAALRKHGGVHGAIEGLLRIFGHVWVACWLLWSREVTYFPQTHCLNVTA